MAKQLNVSLAFTANTNEAIAQLKKLQQEINGLATGSSFKQNGINQLTPQIQTAMKSAAQLQASLEAAVNVNTGKLDLNRFNSSLKSSGMTLQQYANSLSALGPAGNSAFMSLTRSIMQAEAPLLRVNGKLRELGTTLANTARWQISSSILHGFMGAVSSAYGYAQDLNESLNNIRIVTGQNVDQMDAFAEKANKAAKALSTTTTNYTNAALIYYQQGLDDEQVQQRTDTTIKLANVAGIGAEEASDQLTAIWNNFDNGTQSLEHYADVLVKLGAETASSSDEISAGMEKFAAVADMIGLSYENAAAALATVTATTRQSADVVGTAYKTIFARIQGLQLGETLEDGTDLNKYSKALNSVGISIKDVNGDMKTMDQILPEMMDKWNTLGKDQQIALAQTVAGVRQYTQLVALMDNQEFFKQNLASAQNADGALQGQADIYAESWEAAKDRVTAAAQDIYDSLINDDFFIELDNIATGILSTIANVIDGLGGMKGVLLVIGSIAAKVFQQQIASGLKNAAESLRAMTPAGRKANEDTKVQALEVAKQNAAKQKGSSSAEVQMAGQAMTQELNIQERLLVNAKNLTQEQVKAAQIRMDGLRTLQQEVQEKARQLDLAKEELATEREKQKVTAMANKAVETRDEKWNALTPEEQAQYNDKNDFVAKNDDVKLAMNQAAKQAGEDFTALNEKVDSFAKTAGKLRVVQNQTDALAKSAETLGNEMDQLSPEGLQEQSQSLVREANIIVDSIGDINEAFGDIGPEAKSSIQSSIETIQGLKDTTELTETQVEELKNALNTLTINADEGTSAALSGAIAQGYDPDNDTQFQQVMDISMQEQQMVGLNATTDGVAQGIMDDINQQGQEGLTDWSQKVTAVTGAVMTLGATVTAVQGVIDVFNDPDASAWDKISAALGAVVMIVPSVISSFTAIKAAGVGAGLSIQASFGWISLVAAAIAAIVGIVYLVNESLNQTPTKKLEKAKEAAQALADAENEAKEAADALKESFDKYGAAKDKLDSCTRGTKEWTDALKEANNAALEVIENLPSNWDADQIKNAYSRNAKTGMLEINDSAIKEAQKDLDAKASAAEYASQVGQISVKQAQNNVDSNKIASSITQQSMVYDSQGGSYSTQALSTKGIEEAIINNIDSLSAAVTDSDFAQALEDIGIDTSMLSDNMELLRDNVINLGDGLDAAAAQAELFAQVNVDRVLGDSYDAATKNMAADILSEKTENYEQDFLGALTNGAQGNKETSNQYGDLKKNQNGSEQAFQDMLAEYNELTGKNWAASNNAVQGTDTNRTFEFFDENGDLKSLRAEQIASEMAAAKALGELTQDAAAAADQLNKLGSTETGQLLKDFYANNNFDSMTEEQMTSNFETDEAGKVTSDSAKQFLLDAYGVDETELESIAATVGKSVDDMVADIQVGANQSLAGLENIGKDLEVNAKKSFDSIDTSNMTIDAQKNLSDAMAQVYREIGSSGTNELASIINNMGEQSDEFAGVINQIDWQNASPESLIAQLNDLGFTTENISAEDLPELIRLMQQASEVSLDSAQAQYNTLHEISGAIEGEQANISEEQYQALAEAGIAAEGYFTELADGTYQLIGDASEFKEIVDSIAMKPMYEAQDQAINDLNALNKAQGLTDSELQGMSQQGQLDLLKAYDYSPDKLRSLEEMPQAGDGGANAEMRAEAIKAAMAEAGISAETIDDRFEEAAQEASKIQQAINETEFNNDVEKFGLNLEETSDYANRLAKDLAGAEGNVEDYIDTARAMAISNQRLDRGLTNLNTNLKDYSKALKPANKGTLEYSKTMSALKDDLADVLNIADGDLISDEFAESMINGGENAADLTKALDGDADAILRLRLAAADNIMLSISSNLPEGSAELATFTSAWDAAKAYVESGNIEVPGADATGLINSLNAMIEAGNMTKEQIEAAMSGLNISADVHTDYVQQEVTVPVSETYESVENAGTGTYEYVDGEGNVKTQTVNLKKRRSYTVEGPPVTMMGYVPKYTVTGTSEGSGSVSSGITKLPSPKASKGATTSGGAGGGSGGGGGSSSPAKKTKPTKKSDVVDRYKEINDSLADLEKALNKAAKAEDRLYGKAQLAKIAEENNLIQQQIALNKDKLSQAEAFLKIDKADLQTAAKEAGLSDFTFDEDGDIINYTSQLTKLYDQLHALEVQKNAITTSSEDQEAFAEAHDMEGLQDKIDNLKDAISQYEDTKGIIEELNETMEDQFNQWQDNNYKEITLDVQFQIDVNDNAMQDLEFTLKQMEDQFYKRAESMALMFNEVPIYEGNLSKYSDEIDALNAAYSNGEISQADYIEGLEEARDGLYDNLESLIELDKAMVEYYGDTLSDAEDELSKYTDQLEACTSTLEHFRNLLGLIGRENDYASIGAILEGQVQTISNQLTVNQEWYDTLIKQKKDLEEQLANTNLGEKEREAIQAAYDAIVVSVNDAYEELLSSTEEYAEAIAAVLENRLAAASNKLSNIFGGGQSIEDYLNDLDRVSTLEEDYLTATNTLYEKNKLIRQANLDMEKAQSNAVKDQYSKYIKYVEELEKGGKLSQFDLKVAQARYELLQAQVALEEAQSAKNQVRLTRDNSGNYNYTYTADQEAINKAQQDYDDAQNNLYNIALEGAKDYASKYAETLQEASDTFKQINEDYQNGTITSEAEYQAKMLEAENYYYELLTNYATEYSQAATILVDELKTEWVANTDISIAKTEEFKDAVDEYIGDCTKYFNDWKDNTDRVTQQVGKDFDDTAQKVEAVTDESDKLATEVTQDVIPAIEEELQRVQASTLAWAAQRDMLQQVIDKYKEIAMQAGQSISSSGGYSASTGYDPNTDYSAVMASLKALDETKYSGLISLLEIQREAKIDGMDLQKDYYGSRVGESDYNIGSHAYYDEDEIRNILKKLGISGFATGGYTGEWGPEGKLAMLHEKEIVLNQNDTANLLKTIEFVSHVVDQIDRNALVAGLGLQNLMTGTVDSSNLGQTIEQEVIVQAEFPNATDQNEIREAILGLANYATQYTNKR